MWSRLRVPPHSPKTPTAAGVSPNSLPMRLPINRLWVACGADHWSETGFLDFAPQSSQSRCQRHHESAAVPGFMVWTGPLWSPTRTWIVCWSQTACGAFRSVALSGMVSIAGLPPMLQGSAAAGEARAMRMAAATNFIDSLLCCGDNRADVLKSGYADR